MTAGASAGSLLAEASRCYAAGQFAEAEALAGEVRRRVPGSPMAAHLLGLCHLAQGRGDEGLAQLEAGLALQPGNDDIRLNLAQARAHRGEHAAVVALLDELARRRPDLGEVCQPLALAKWELGDRPGAIAVYRAHVACRSADGPAHRSLAAALLQTGATQEAVGLFRRAIALQPEDRESMVLLAEALGQVAMAHPGGGPEDSAAAVAANAVLAEAVLAKGGDDDRLRYRMALVLHRANRLDAAAAILAGMVEGDEAQGVDRVGALVELATIRSKQQRLDEAHALHRQALALSPDAYQTNINMALIDLLRGQFAQGWPRYECRRQKLPYVPQPAAPDAAPWIAPACLAGVTVRVVLEQGIGDTLNFIRYVPMLAARGARVELAVPIHGVLLPLLRGVAGVAAVVEAADSAPVPEIVVPLLSLPLAFGTDAATIPGDVPYLAAPAERRAVWRDRLGPGDGRPRIGVVWFGSATYANDRLRSIPLAQFRRVMTRDDLAFHVLSDRLRDGDAALLDGVASVHAGIADFADTAALVAEMDLVIAVDTSVAHLAGALGRPVWILLPAAPDWRWLVGRDDSPWYPSARLFRQAKHLDWDSVLDRVEEALRVAFP